MTLASDEPSLGSVTHAVLHPKQPSNNRHKNNTTLALFSETGVFMNEMTPAWNPYHVTLLSTYKALCASLRCQMHQEPFCNLVFNFH